MSKTHFTTIALVLAMATTVYAQTYKVLYNFGSNPGDPTCPSATFAQSPGGNLYGEAANCYSDQLGAAFRMSLSGTLTVLHHFSGGFDGRYPEGSLNFATDQRFHGTTYYGGMYGKGTIFKIAPDGKVTTLYSFTGGADGTSPEFTPIQSVSGNFYGTLTGDFGNNTGSVYKITGNGDFTILHTFAETDGLYPFGPLIQGSDYGFYGVTGYGGKYGGGTIFRIGSQGNYKVLYDFDVTHGGLPVGPLIQANEGNLYGITYIGGSSGVIFKLTPSLTFTVLHYFSGSYDGWAVLGGLMEASDGNFYGTNAAGGANGHGVLFRITPAGVFTVLHNFDESTGFDSETTLMQHTNGKLYGSTQQGGSGGGGVVYRVDLGLPPFVTFLNVYGRVGAKVDILGQHFTNESIVSFNGVPAVETEIHPTYIKAIVPDGATTGDITVTSTSGTLKSNKVFVVH